MDVVHRVIDRVDSLPPCQAYGRGNPQHTLQGRGGQRKQKAIFDIPALDWFTRGIFDRDIRIHE
jgi:hypothetical protein